MGRLKRSGDNRELRGGYTTGACAAAAARAAVRMLLTGQELDAIAIILPNGDSARFTLARLEQGEKQVLAGVIKDGGDDPDCTHGLEIQCTACWADKPGIHLAGGEGVATVTLPGLELPVGEPAINPVPRANILQMAELEWRVLPAAQRRQKGLRLTISVPQGLEAARETISERLGLIGGISILGTRGTVKPFSTSAYAASVRQSVQIAAANGLQQVVLTTGGRSEQAAMQLLPALTPMAFIQAGDFIGVGLRAAKRYQLRRVTVVAMIGKLGKLVCGHMMTHVSGHAIDFSRLSQLAQEEKLPESLCIQLARANTGRHLLEMVRNLQPDGHVRAYLDRLCREAEKHADSYTAGALEIEVLLIDFDGTLLGSSQLTGNSQLIGSDQLIESNNGSVLNEQITDETENG